MSILETILRWIVHAAVFRAVWSAPGAAVAAGAALAVLGWWALKRHRERTRQ